MLNTSLSTKSVYFLFQLALVGQEPVLYARSIQDNVSYGLSECPFDEVKHACELSNAHKFVIELESGYETQAGEKGTQLSGQSKNTLSCTEDNNKQNCIESLHCLGQIQSLPVIFLTQAESFIWVMIY